MLGRGALELWRCGRGEAGGILIVPLELLSQTQSPYEG